ncbi:hypothetical protein GCM10012289_73420 [Nonomuraea cavernae]|uniref:Uncharacterized protein n=2 Tax=Nonomuraea cavernae TaxID=2045107 RepID=A0A918DSN4_9ACTN|nr:hypothetical protein GCM10012289_73420 [Nonomuraea cavernae]
MLESLDSAGRFVSGFLAGEIDETTNPALEEDDLLMLAVLTLDRTDPGWVLARIADSGVPVCLRAQLLWPMMRTYAEGYDILHREDPHAVRHLPTPGRHSGEEDAHHA